MTTVNKFLRFRRLLPQRTRYTITVTEIKSDGTTVGTTRDGGKVRVLGDSVAVGLKAWVDDGRIVGEAPDLPEFIENI